jgi:hypothetical protein
VSALLYYFKGKIRNRAYIFGATKDEVVEKARLMIDRWWEYIAKMHPIVLTVKQPKHTVKGAILLDIR